MTAALTAEQASNAVRLLEEAMHLRMNGEYAPGGRENWRDWDRKADTFLRQLALEGTANSQNEPEVDVRE
jgi:hypothetical protein